MTIFIIIGVIITWFLFGVIGFLIFAKANGYIKADDWLVSEFWMYVSLGCIGFIIGIWEALESIEIGIKITQFLLNLINCKTKKNKEK